MYELRAPIEQVDRDAIEFFLFESGEEHQWIMYDDVDTKEMSVQGVFESPEEAKEAWDHLSKELSAPCEPVTRELHDSDWKDSYKEHFKPWSIGTIHWVPDWLRESYELPEGHKAIWLDPGMAFGTGNHGTTRLCVEQLIAFSEQRSDRGAAKVVDAGCGSGILAISAAKLGFENVHAFDNDPDAVRIAKENAETNEVSPDILHDGDLVTGFPAEPVDCVMANILANVLMRFSDEIEKSVGPGGWLILSGILGKEAEEVKAHFEKYDSLSDGSITYLDEWSAIRFVKA